MVDQEIPSHKLRRTPLFGVLKAHGGQMVGFAGYESPIQFDGIKSEHIWTRSHVGLFDVSHMGPSTISLRNGLGREGAHEEISKLIERLVPSDIRGLRLGQSRLTVLLSEDGGILDDFIVTRPAEEGRQGSLDLVVNGACKEDDWNLIETYLGGEVQLERKDTHVLFALQGPQASDVMKSELPSSENLGFMRSRSMRWRDQVDCNVSRCGYTGEDGFEILIEPDYGIALVEKFLSYPEVKPVGLGARDSLRLEAGLCLYGQDIDATRSPVEANLTWLISKRRREAEDFRGSERILREIKHHPDSLRVGIQPLERAPARGGTQIYKDGKEIGTVTSGGFGPSVDRPIAMGYVDFNYSAVGTEIELLVREKLRPAKICSLPFIPPRNRIHLKDKLR